MHLDDRLIQGIRDYFYLIDKNFPEKGSLKLVGDRYKLTGDERTVLFRGIASEKKNKARLKRLTTNLENELLIIDGYNVVFTLLNYLMGRSVFICTDGLCRDAGSLFGKIKNQQMFLKSLEKILQHIHNCNAHRIVVYFDSPISFSGEHRQLTERIMQQLKIPGIVNVVQSADHAIKKHTSGIICTSDSAIIDFTKQKIADITKLIILKKYHAKLLNLNYLVEPDRRE